MAGVVLVITFGSLIAAGLPLLTALIGVGISVSVIASLASAMDFDSTTSVLAMMIGLAVGIDYALFIVSRYRAELDGGHDPEDAAGRAAGTAGSAVFFAGLTVVIALVGLAVVNIPMLTKMGLAAAGTVVVAVLVALTLVPAVLGFAGRRVRGRKARRRQQDPERLATSTPKPGTGTRWAQFVLRRPVTAAAVIMIAVFAGFAGSAESMIKLIGFSLAVAVFFDAFVVRMAIVPAVLALLGDKAWWLPRWLDRLLPNVDVEGDQLRKKLAGEQRPGQGPDSGQDRNTGMARV